jgi:hypothetical protein
MKRDDAANLLGRIGVLRSRCDLDLLIFFARHPTALLTSEQLAAWLGHELRAIAVSLDTLLEARLVRREQNPSHAARMYIFQADAPTGEWLPSLVQLAKSREGRLALINALSSRSPGGSQGTRAIDKRDANDPIHAPLLSLVRTAEIQGPDGGSNPPERTSRQG